MNTYALCANTYALCANTLAQRATISFRALWYCCKQCAAGNKYIIWVL